MAVIHIIGNICSGKSTAVTWLKKQYPKAIYAGIDDYRREYGDGSKEGEDAAWNKLLENCQKWHNARKIVFLESSGTSWRLKYFPISLFIFINTDPEVCSVRVIKRGKTNVPWPYGGVPEDSIEPIQKKLEEKVQYYATTNPKKIIVTTSEKFHEVIQDGKFLGAINGTNS